MPEYPEQNGDGPVGREVAGFRDVDDHLVCPAHSVFIGVQDAVFDGAVAVKIGQCHIVIVDEMDRQLTLKRSNFLWRKATKRLDSILDQYKDLPKGVHAHTDSRIFPSAAIYLTAKEYIPAEKAYCIIENAAIKNTTELEHKLARMMKIQEWQACLCGCGTRSAGGCSGRAAGLKTCFIRKKRMRTGWISSNARITGILLN